APCYEMTYSADFARLSPRSSTRSKKSRIYKQRDCNWATRIVHCRVLEGRCYAGLRDISRRVTLASVMGSLQIEIEKLRAGKIDGPRLAVYQPWRFIAANCGSLPLFITAGGAIALQKRYEAHC